MLKVASIWGGCAGALYIAVNWFSLAKRLELNAYPAWGLIYTALLIIILGTFIFISMRQTRSKFYAETGINFAQTFYAGVITSLITGLMAGTFAFIYIQFLEPGFTEHIITEATQAMQKNKVAAKDIQQNVAEMKQIYTANVQFMSLLIITFIIGIICSAILSVFVRNRDTFSTTRLD